MNCGQRNLHCRDNILTDVCGGLSSLAAATSSTRWLETLSLHGLFLFLTSPTSLNCLTHFLIKFLCGRDLLNLCLHLLWAVMIDSVSWTNLTNLVLPAAAANVIKRVKLWRHSGDITITWPNIIKKLLSFLNKIQLTELRYLVPLKRY